MLRYINVLTQIFDMLIVSAICVQAKKNNRLVVLCSKPSVWLKLEFQGHIFIRLLT
jgi:hypothetical protein